MSFNPSEIPRSLSLAARYLLSLPVTPYSINNTKGVWVDAKDWETRRDLLDIMVLLLDSCEWTKIEFRNKKESEESVHDLKAAVMSLVRELAE